LCYNAQFWNNFVNSQKEGPLQEEPEKEHQELVSLVQQDAMRRNKPPISFRFVSKALRRDAAAHLPIPGGIPSSPDFAQVYRVAARLQRESEE
jgi:hypothetical protein